MMISRSFHSICFLLLLCVLCSESKQKETQSFYRSVLQSLKLTAARPPKIKEGPPQYSNNLRLRYLQEEEDDEELSPSVTGSNTIFGGEDAEEGEFPWFVELKARNGQIAGERRCAGVMLSGDTVVTLASCLYTANGIRADPTESIAIVKRNEVKRGEGVERNWKIMREHPNYVFGDLANNIAVLVISGEPLFPEEDIGLLNSNGGQPATNSTVTALGYGETRLGSGPARTLQKADFLVLNGVGPCNITSNSTFYCADTVDAYASSSSSSASGDEDFCIGDEGAPFTRNDRTLYGLYLEGGTCSGQGDTAAIVLKINPLREWILVTACEVSAARCARSCTLLSGLSLGMDSFVGRLVDTAGAVWDWVSGPIRTGEGEGGVE